MPRSRRDDEDDDDRPQRKTRRNRDDDAEDDEEDDRPRKRKVVKSSQKKTGGGSGRLLLIFGLAGGLFLLLVGGGVAGWLLFFNENPRSAFEDFQNGWASRNYGRVYDRYDADNRRLMDVVTGPLKMDPKHRDKSGRELFILMYEEYDKNPNNSGRVGTESWRQKATVESVKEEGNTATLTVKTADGRTQTVTMKKEDGKWRVGVGPGWGR